MSKFLYVSFARNSFLVSDGEGSFQSFEMYNYEDCVPSVNNVSFYNRKTKQTDIILKSNDLEKSNYKVIPYVPIFQSLYSCLNINNKNFQIFIKDRFSISGLIFKHKIIVVIPDDFIFIDGRCITEFFNNCSFVKQNGVFMVKVGILLSKTHDSSEPRCVITKSVRAVSVSLVMYGGFIDQKIFIKEFNDINQIKVIIDLWSNKYNLSNLPVYLYGNDIELFSSLGTIFTDDEIIKSLRIIDSDLTNGLFKNVKIKTE